MVTYSFFIKITPLYAKSDEREFDDLEVLFDKEILPGGKLKESLRRGQRALRECHSGRKEQRSRLH